jgi:hypothetical protein
MQVVKPKGAFRVKKARLLAWLEGLDGQLNARLGFWGRKWCLKDFECCLWMARSA